MKSNGGHLFLIPREPMETGDYLTRVYAFMGGVDQDMESTSGREESQKARQNVTLEKILQEVSRIIAPYRIQPKSDREVDWWSSYQIGKRVSDHFLKRDSAGTPRVFLVGDGKFKVSFSVLC